MEGESGGAAATGPLASPPIAGVNAFTEMMSMVLHFGEREVVLFSFWKTGSVAGMAVSMLIVFLLCFLYEAIKALRIFIALEHSKKKRRAERAQHSQERPSPSTSHEEDTRSVNSQSFAPLLRFRGAARRLFTGFRVVQAVLYGLQALLAYTLMLVVMTFNVWLIMSVVLGEAIGYFLFTGTPLLEDSLSDCC